MHGDDGNVIFQGFHYATLHVVGSAYLFQSAKQQRVVTDYEVAATLHGLVNYLLVDVQTQ